MRSYFYDDYGFIAVLLDGSRSEHKAANAIADYFLSRLKQLLKLDWDTALHEFEKHFGRTVPSTQETINLLHPLPGGLCNDARLHAQGVEELERLVCEVADTEQTDLVQRLMCQLDAQRLQKRQLLCLGSLEAEIEVNIHDRVSVWPKDSGLPHKVPTFNASAMEGVREGTASGSLEFYLLPNDHARASTIIREHEVVYVNFDGELGDEQKKQLTLLFGTRARDLKMIEEQEANLEIVVADDAIRIVRAQAKKTAPEGIEQLYRWLTTIPIEDDRWNEAAQKLSSGGFFRLCDNDGDFIRGLSFLGVVSSVNPDKTEIAELARARGFDLEELLRQAKALEAATGFPTIREVDGKIVVLV